MTVVDLVRVLQTSNPGPVSIALRGSTDLFDGRDMHQEAGPRYTTPDPLIHPFLIYVWDTLTLFPQVALDRTKPNGKVVGIDIIPAQPPRGVTTIQGNFLYPGVQDLVKDYLLEVSKRGGVDDLKRLSSQSSSSSTTPSSSSSSSTWSNIGEPAEVTADENPATTTTIIDKPSYIDTERSESLDSDEASWASPGDEEQGRLVDVRPPVCTLYSSPRFLLSPKSNSHRTLTHTSLCSLCTGGAQRHVRTLGAGGALYK